MSVAISNVIEEAAQPLTGEHDDFADQFDAVLHFDETQALEPLERYALWESGEPPETFPIGV